MSAARRRLWSEMVPYDRIAEPSVLAELSARRIDLLAAVTPGTGDRAPWLVDRCRAAGVGIGLWPMLEDRHGRWPSAANAERFAPFCRELVASLQAAGALPDEIAIDLEPPIDRVRAALNGRWRALVGPPNPAGMATLADLVSDLRSLVRVSAAITPLAALPSALASAGWQEMLGTPVDGLGFDTINTMVYTSLFEGYSRGLLRRADSLAMLGAIAATCAGRWGSRAAISLGVVGPGALGDERSYRNPGELAEDVSVAGSAGIEEIVLFALDGILARQHGAWLDAFCGEHRAPSARPTPRSWAALAAGSAVGMLAAGVGRLRRVRS